MVKGSSEKLIKANTQLQLDYRGNSVACRIPKRKKWGKIWHFDAKNTAADLSIRPNKLRGSISGIQMALLVDSKIQTVYEFSNGKY